MTDMLRATITEKDFQAAVIDLGRLRGWHVYHTFDSRHSAAGFPDLTMVRDRRLVFAELKAERGRVSVPQQVWIGELRQARQVEAHLWRPSDWPTLTEILR